MSSPDEHVVVVGGSTGAVRTVQALRRVGFDGRLTMVSDESHMPYDRPPLSKDLLAEDHAGDPVPLLTVEQAADLHVEVLLDTRASGLDPLGRTVTVDHLGQVRQISYDHLVIATGAAARRLPGPELDAVHVIRCLDDVARLRHALGAARRAVVIGAGFIGAEFASAARSRGMEVTLVEAQPHPFAQLLGEEVGAEVAGVHAAHGAQLLTGVGVEAVRTAADGTTEVVLADGRVLPTDVVVVGVGAVPNTAWLVGSGLPVMDGIECSADLEVVGWPDIHAVGDVARWPHPSYPTPIRVEHWTNAGDHAEIVAAHLTGARPPRPTVPYVWSDQYGHRIQIVGRPGEGELARRRGSMEAGDLVAVYATDAGAVVGAIVVDDPRLLMKLRKAVTAGTTAAELDETFFLPA
ncbi:NADPH-dependent 2,4-dienoyl-CoA reductase/sulfur reductase-like enzyme [Nocardioides sp. BE266]|uniref:NAD(P)/FAD-dependent oxidoreductase n=1 Tax=Nocardioides sp. BE266 TaxID=2817725 RepID=UPI0028562C38|nr:FAD/NAD(P)-binding oxidoreductase [Nocardioides sp. BE266]MDR7254210.1 NADPH-dependent 2,4-dienoyl-CoA reductase/sulfur reductase-like enzyme [Nocardioides sp. BE266]